MDAFSVVSRVTVKSDFRPVGIYIISSLVDKMYLESVLCHQGYRGAS